MLNLPQFVQLLPVLQQGFVIFLNLDFTFSVLNLFLGVLFLLLLLMKSIIPLTVLNIY